MQRYLKIPRITVDFPTQYIIYYMHYICINEIYMPNICNATIPKNTSDYSRLSNPVNSEGGQIEIYLLHISHSRCKIDAKLRGNPSHKCFGNRQIGHLVAAMTILEEEKTF